MTLFVAIGLAALWFVLTSADPASWLMGLPAVGLATWLFRRLGERRQVAVAPGAIFRYLGFFVIESLRAGVDVAVRALAPGRRFSPHLLDYETSLPPGWPRTLFANTVSLLPGTLSVSLDDERLTVHALSADSDPVGGLAACERRIAALLRADPAP